MARGASSDTLTVLRMVASEWVANEDGPKKCPGISLPSRDRTPLLPSRCDPPKLAATARSQYAGRA